MARSTERKLFRFLISTIGVATVLPSTFDVDVDVGVAAEAPLLHLAVGDAEVAEGQPEFFQAGLGILWTADVGLGDDLQQRDPRPIQVNLRETPCPVRQLAGVFFEVDASRAAHRPPPEPSF